MDCGRDQIGCAREVRQLTRKLEKERYAGSKRKRLAELMGVSVPQVDRYIALSKAIDPLLQMVEMDLIAASAITNNGLYRLSYDEQRKFVRLFNKLGIQGVRLTREVVTCIAHKYKDGLWNLEDVAEFSAQTEIEHHPKRKSRKDQQYSLDDMDGREFEEWVSHMLCEMEGFEVADITPISSDSGADILGELNGVKYVFQCKKLSKGVVGIEALQEVFLAKALRNADVAVIVTNAGFTTKVCEDAEKVNVRLWDARRIERWIKS